MLRDECLVDLIKQGVERCAIRMLEQIPIVNEKDDDGKRTLYLAIERKIPGLAKNSCSVEHT